MLNSLPLHRPDRSGRPKLATELRNAGYHDLERAPRLRNHWANQSGSVKARFHLWRKLRSAR